MTDHDASTLCRACDQYRDPASREKRATRMKLYRVSQVSPCRLGAHPVTCRYKTASEADTPEAASNTPQEALRLPL